MKSLLIFVSAIGVCLAASLRPNELPNEQILDSNGYFIFRWGFPPGTGDIEMEIQANCSGWFGIGISNPDGSSVDIIMGGYDDVTGEGYLEDRWSSTSDPVNGGTLDESNDVILKGAIYHEPWSVIRIARSINTGDFKDVAIVPGVMVVGWAYANTDDMSVEHDLDGRGLALVNFNLPAN